MSRKRNRRLREFILDNVESYRDSAGHISWQSLIDVMYDEFPRESLTVERIRSIYRNSHEDELRASKRRAGVGEVKYKKDDDEEDFEVPEPNQKESKERVIKRQGKNLEANITTDENPANFSIEEIVTLFGLDENKWECTGYTAKAWNASAKNGTGKTDRKTYYSVKAKFKLKKKETPEKEDLEWIFDMAKEASFEKYGLAGVPRVDYSNRGKDNTLVLAIFDQHLGKLAWGKETGENYDIKIGANRFLEKAKSILDRAHRIGFSKIIFPIGNDFFQIDNEKSETTGGTRVDSDIRWQKLLPLGIDLLREVIGYASKMAPVDVILVQGNHDNAMSFSAFQALRGWYHNNPNVFIDDDIKKRTYRKVGINLLGFTHGDKEKKRIYEIMQHEAREAWGKTRYAEWITGHYHKSLVDERFGVTKRVVGSLTGTDAWHYEKGFVGAHKSAQGIIYNKNQIGPYVIIHETVDLTKELAQKD